MDQEQRTIPLASSDDHRTASGVADENRDGLVVLADETFQLSGDVHRLVTFLNRSLKDDDYIFGLRLADEDRYRLTIYRA